MQKQCVHCTVGFEVTDEDLQFYDKVSPVFNGVKYSIPAPTHCPDCRQQRRIAHENERNLYPSICKLCAKKILSQYSPNSGVIDYCRECFYSDKWDPRDYGMDFDFSRPFFDQIRELKLRTPGIGLNVQGNIQNCDYIHYAGTSKNCYLIMHADFCDDCYYGYGFKHNTSCMDGFYNLGCELCFDCVDVNKCYDLKGCQDCHGCHSSFFLRDCIGCKNCFLCVGLRQKEFCYENQQLTREQYEAKMTEIDLGSYAVYQWCKGRLKELESVHNFKHFQNTNVTNCTGDHLTNCKDLYYCFDCEDVETGRYLFQVVTGAKDCYDIYQYGLNLQMSYECATVGEDSYHMLFTENGHVSGVDVYYSWYVERCKYIFGCANMHGKQYCILNKQYTEEEYNALVPKIIEHMKSTGEFGEFFPMNKAVVGYNESTAQIYYPLTKEQALAKGLLWNDYQVPPPKVEKVLEGAQVPDNIKEVGDDILNFAIKCEITGKLFKIIPQELKFLRRQGLPLPRRHQEQRHLDRFALRNPRRFAQRACGGCGVGVWTTHLEETGRKVLCEGCFEKAVY
ncbi:hypothetical protein HOG48_00410 [Candidatus Peregrinibacteria bacterium]|jgi:hypothetical protein|nr:hypothetical protein [Candidatus Peregrinibacteria bacterium]